MKTKSSKSMLKTFLFLTFLIKSIIADDYPNIVGPSAPEIQVGVAISGAIEVDGDVDVFKIKLVAGRVYRFTLEAINPPSPNFDNQLIFYDASGNQIASADDVIGKNAVITYTITATGYYYIKAKAYYVSSATSKGTYALAGMDTISCSAGCQNCQATGSPSPCTICGTGYQCLNCYNAPSSAIIGSVCPCYPSETFGSSTCLACESLDPSCLQCSSMTACTVCSGSLLKYGATCVPYCPVEAYQAGTSCFGCNTVHPSCTACNSSIICTQCSGGLFALGASCETSCPSNTYNNGGLCTSCKTLDNYCTSCNGTLTCTGCSNSKYALGSECVDNCPYGTFIKTGMCTSCATLDDFCLDCNGTSHCIQCSGGLVALGPNCVPTCPPTTYDKAGICTACATLDDYCISCNSTVSCLGCSGGLLALGSNCIFSCPVGTYDNNGMCTSCYTLDDYCSECSNNRFCSLCDNKMLILGSNCVTKCPKGYQNTEGICSKKSYKITLAYTTSASSYLVQFPPALVSGVDVIQVTNVVLEGVDDLIYTYTLTKKSHTIYQIDFQFTKNIPSTTLKLRYTLNGWPVTSNPLIGRWTGTIVTKYMGYISESDKELTETLSTTVSGAITGVTAGAGSVALFGGNPALLWPLLSLFQAFYYLIFIDVNYPANVQIFLKVFSLGSLGFLPNPLEWFVQDIDNYDLPVPRRYNDYDFSGLFLDNSGNELLLLALVFGIYMVAKAVKKWFRRVPTGVRSLTNRTVGWFEWSGILRSLITSYTDMAQAIFLQMRVLSFYSTAFMLSSVLSFVALSFVILFPIGVFLVIRGFSDHPELLFVKYQTLVQEYSVKKKAGRYFIPIWLVRRLVMCLSLVFLQGYPYVQINMLCILVLTSIYHSWVYAPYNTKKENICNTIMEILFGCIHAVIYVLIYDDHNPYFTEGQRLQMSWVIIIACGVILVISIGLNVFEQIKEAIRGLRLLKEMMSSSSSKADEKKKSKRRRVKRHIITTSSEQSEFIDLNRTQDGLRDTPLSEENSLVTLNQSQYYNRRVPLSQLRRQRKERLAVRIGELRGINKSAVGKKSSLSKYGV